MKEKVVKKGAGELIRTLAETAELVPFGFLVVRDVMEDDRILEVNSTLWKNCGCGSKEEFLEYTDGRFSKLIYPDDLKTVLSRLQFADKNPDEWKDTDAISKTDDLSMESYAHIYYRIRTKSGKDLHVEDTCCLVYDPKKRSENSKESKIFTHYFSLSDRERNQNIFDLVTGLHQKDYLYKWLSDQYTYDREHFADRTLGTVYLNSRGFRQFNETYGYAEGDRLLRKLGEQIELCFQTTMATRLYGDRFVIFCNADRAEKGIKTVHDWAEKNYPKDNLDIIGGIYYPSDPGTSPEISADLAKIACDRIPEGGKNCFNVYTEELARSIKKKEYIQTHIDEAVEKGWLCIYIQPVVRTLTKHVCSGEALARWKDPVYGMISPGEFVPALEEKGLSYKLALFVIDRTARLISQAQKAGKPALPISINFSRRDFDTIDPYEEVEKAVLQYDVPRSMIYIEVTESMAMENSEKIRNAIARFHKSGYEMWMDDFGSAYSSLNTLKDFDFDEIKLDMIFMRNMNDRAREIIRSCINMAKHLHIHTLCEGVETKEQVEFLRDTGCEKIQGFYYFKPCDPSELYENLKKRGMSIESSAERYLYDSIGNLSFSTGPAWALISCTPSELRTVYCSPKLRKEAKRKGYTGFLVGKTLKSDAPGYAHRIGSLIRNCTESEREEEISYFVEGHYFAVSAEVQASFHEEHLCRVSIRDTTEESRQLLLAGADSVTQSFANVYDSIYLFRPEHKELQVIRSNFPNERAGKTMPYSSGFFSSCIYWRDRERFRRWIKKGLSGQTEYKSSAFRFMHMDETYTWYTITLIPYAAVEENEEGQYLICTRMCTDNAEQRALAARTDSEREGISGETGNEVSENQMYADAILNALRDQRTLKIFWKDRKRRFLGASKAFLEYYQLPSEKAILGKTDEDIGWNTDNADFRESEEKVLRFGKTQANHPGRNFLKGKVRDIADTKFPITYDGKIVGLMGYFFDGNEIRGTADLLEKHADTDVGTGLMSIESWFGTLSMMENNFIKEGTDYYIAVINMKEFRDVRKNFGIDNAENMASATANVLKETLGENALLSRIDLGTFVLAERAAFEKKPAEDSGNNVRKALLDGLAKAGKKLSNEMWLGLGHSRVTLGYGVSSRKESTGIFQMIEKAVTREERH